MTTTPLFDAIAHRSDRSPRPLPAQRRNRPTGTRTTAVPAVGPALSLVAPVAVAPVAAAPVPEALVAAIDGIPARFAASTQEFRITEEQRAMVEALGDTFIRVVVDTLAEELERIVRDRVVRG